ncbi:hypothetical protein HL658_35800 [Azospirillum sp. RWY-5-1]|uniref:MarR family transcriptional regulator n=1 Tax=Azospirillum oleiclasticum TaxID=2735135 RepID=A0ABX2TJT8_9PROT|nr:hypothetical protein [Azospirillum oleiclasticum]NYZ17935.1 hypothetical protein [Azospirillum oleiclasticum]NYZ24617.1 hypothetical protein [Azospirillum oleiclasticum]
MTHAIPPDAFPELAAFALGGLSAALEAAAEPVRQGWEHRMRVRAAVGDGDGRLLEARLAGLPIDARLRLDRGALARAEARYRLSAGGEETAADAALRGAGGAGLAGIAAAAHGWLVGGGDGDALPAAVPRALAYAFGGSEPAGVVGVTALAAEGEGREAFVRRFLRAAAVQAAAGREALAALAAARAEAVRRLMERARTPPAADGEAADLAALLEEEPRPPPRRRRAPRSDSRALAAIDRVTVRPMGAAALAAALGLTVRGASALADGLVAVGALADLSPLKGRRCYALPDRVGLTDALHPPAEPVPVPPLPRSPSGPEPDPVPPLDLDGLDGELRALLRDADAAIGRIRRRLSGGGDG